MMATEREKALEAVLRRIMDALDNAPNGRRLPEVERIIEDYHQLIDGEEEGTK